MYERLLATKLPKWRKSLLVLGPRQVGKSTLLQAMKPDLTINLAQPSLFKDYVMYPERLEKELTPKTAQLRTVLIDEVQKVPALLDGVQYLLDEYPRQFRFLLS